MITYILAFIFYTLAMIGILLVGFVVYKKFMSGNKNEKKGMIKILDSISIAPKKNLLVVRVRNEKFLIAIDSERTTFLSKLAPDEKNKKETIAIEPINQQQTNKTEQEKFNDIQQRFMELYSQNDEEEEQNLTKKDMIHKLLKDLNKTNVKTGSY